MKRTKILVFQDEYDHKMNKEISDWEAEGWEVSQVLTASGYGGGLSAKHFVTIVMNKEDK